jgi:HlyD family secretion protein
MQSNNYLMAALLLVATSCNRNNAEFDATGNFEADEVIISAEASGKIIKLNIEEGTELKSQTVIGLIDTTQLHLRKKQLEYSIRAVNAKQPNANVQLAAITEQIEHLHWVASH